MDRINFYLKRHRDTATVIIKEDDKIVHTELINGSLTDALIYSLEYIKLFSIKHFIIHSDSEHLIYAYSGRGFNLRFDDMDGDDSDRDC